MPKYRPARGGHAPGHLREQFCDYIETGHTPVDVKWLTGQLWNCTDTLPSCTRNALDSDAHTYAQAARAVRSSLS